jgi:type II secretory pathway pseudopilin PulG
MNMHGKVKGITLIGFVIVLAVLGFFGYLAMRLIPAYTEYYGVVKSMEQERSEAGAAAKSLDMIRRDLAFKFSTQYVDEANVPPQAITLKREGGASTLRVNYERRIPFMYNIELLATFDKSVSMTGAGE